MYHNPSTIWALPTYEAVTVAEPRDSRIAQGALEVNLFMHDICSYTLNAVIHADTFCDCLYIGLLAGVVGSFALLGLFSIFSDLVKFLIKWFKSKKKPHSQA